MLHPRVARPAGIKLADRQVERLQKAAEKAEQAQAKIEKRRQEWAQLWVLCCTSLFLESCGFFSDYSFMHVWVHLKCCCWVAYEEGLQWTVNIIFDHCDTDVDTLTELWCLSYVEKPGEDCEDPQAVEAIRIAMETIGDLKLKSAKDYNVPKHLRMNPEGKREQLKALEETVETQIDILWHTLHFNH